VDQPAPFGTLLKRHRETAGLTQEALAAQAGVSVRGISDLERGVNRAPRPVTLGLLAQALRLTDPERARLEAAASRLGGTAALAVRDVEQPFSSGRPPLVGRAWERSLLEAHLACTGPPLLLFAGEPGIGKSRLLHEAARLGAAAGWRVLLGGCTRRGGQAPYAPLLEALEHHLRSRSPAQLRADLQGCAWLVRLLPELADGPIEELPRWVVSPEQERRLLFRAVDRYLANVAGPTGTLLVLDDLQWAGADALELLVALVRTAGPPLQVIGAYRATDLAADHPLAVTCAELAEAQLVTLRTLGPLARREAEDLFASLLGSAERVAPAVVAQVVERAGGVPFFLVSYARSLEGEGAEQPAQVGLPWDLRQSLQRRMRALPEAGQALLAAAAVAGRVTPRSLLLAVLARPESEVIEALEQACRAGLLEEVGDDAYGFVHDVIREVAGSDLGQARRAFLHRRTAEALEGRPGAAPAEMLAYHYGRSDVPDRALPYWEQAGDAARDQAAHGAAERYYREAISRLDGLGRAVEAARLREKLGAVLLTTAHFTRALEVLEQAATALRLAGDAEGLGRVVARIGHVHYQQGTLAEGVERLLLQLETLAAVGPSASLAALYQALARLYSQLGQFRAALAAATRAAEVARLVGDQGLLARAERPRGYALLMLGRVEEALAAIQEAGALAKAEGDLEVLGWVAQTLAWLAEERGDLDRGRQHATRARTLGERLGDPVRTLLALCRLTAQAFFAGAWGEAHAYIERFQELPDRSPENDAAALLEPGRLLLAEGEWEQAARYLEHCSAIARHAGNYTEPWVAQSFLAELDLLEGRPESALARLLPLQDRDGMEEWIVTIHVLPVLAWAYLELGDTEQAARTVAEALRRQRAGQLRRALVDTLRVQALVALRQGTVQTAADALEEGLNLAQAMPYPHGEGRLLAVYGRLHLERGDVTSARERLEAASTIFQRLGARKDLERAEQLLATLG
jgi:tetratricopeptide (TPR) repeat protein/transcriptional regulator with XRE-family HTH domain